MEGSFSMKKTYLAFLLTALCLPTFVAGQETVAQLTKQATDISKPKPVVYGPGDEVVGKVIGESDYDFEAMVDENGQILLPFSSTPIIAQCKTQLELHAEITKLLKKDLVNPQWTLRTKTRVRPSVTVFGEVLQNAKVELTRKATLFEMMGQSGGVKDDAGQIVQVYRPQRITCSDGSSPNEWRAESGDPNEVPFRVYNLAEMEKGVAAHNPEILPGDVIFVPKAAPVYVTGEVVVPQGILLKKQGGTTVSEAISMVSGLRPEAKKKDIKIYRKKDGYDQRGEPISVNLELIRAGKQNDIFLEPYDLVVVDKTKKSIALTIAEFAIGAGKQVITSAANSGGVRVIY